MLHRKLKLQTCLKGGKFSGRVSKSPPNHLSKSSKQSFWLYSQWFEIIEKLGIFKPWSIRKGLNKLTVVQVSIDTSRSSERKVLYKINTITLAMHCWFSMWNICLCMLPLLSCLWLRSLDMLASNTRGWTWCSTTLWRLGYVLTY